MKKIAIIIFALPILFGCEPKFDPSDDFSEVDVVYGVLNADAPKQYIQVGRGFQTNGGNAIDIAKNNDSIYHQDSIIVELIELQSNGKELSSATLKKEEFDDREDGIFASPKHYLYTLDSTDYKVKDETSYKIKVTNTVTLKSSYSKITTLKPYEFVYEGPDGVSLSHVIGNNLDSIVDRSFDIKNENGQYTYYDTKIIIPILTKDKDGNVIAFDTLENVISNKTQSKSGDETRFTANGNAFFNLLFNSLEPLIVGSDEKREFGICFIEINCYSTEIYEYILAEDNFNALSQSKPFYSNVYDVATNETQAGVVGSMKLSTEVASYNFNNNIDYIKKKRPDLGF